MTDSARGATGRLRGRVGRPPLDQFGAVETRILDAALAAFLNDGFDGTRMERVAEAAGAGKASVYARFENKDALFAATIEREIARAMQGVDHVPNTGLLADRLRASCAAVVETSLTPRSVAMMRLMIGVAGRFPALAGRIEATGRQQATRRIAEALTGKSPADDGWAESLAGDVLDLVFAPLQLRALLGEELALLRGEVAVRVRAAVTLLSASGRLPDET